MNKETKTNIRFCMLGPSSDEGEVLIAALESASSQRRGSDVLRALVMRGWVDLIHNCDPKERSIQLRSLGISSKFIAEVERRWPVSGSKKAEAAQVVTAQGPQAAVDQELPAQVVAVDGLPAQQSAEQLHSHVPDAAHAAASGAVVPEAIAQPVQADGQAQQPAQGAASPSPAVARKPVTRRLGAASSLAM